MLRACTDALIRVAAQCGPSQIDQAASAGAAPSGTRLGTSPAAHSGLSSSGSEPPSSAIAEAAAAAKPMDSAAAAAEADAELPAVSQSEVSSSRGVCKSCFSL